MNAVKPLIWRHSHADIYHGLFGGDGFTRQLYQLRGGSGGSWVLEWMVGSPWDITTHISLEAAQAAAQEEWRAFVAAALGP